MNSPCPSFPRSKVKRVEEIETGLARCHALSSPKLREQVYSMETGSDAISAVCFHPYHPVVCLSDQRGMVKVREGEEPHLISWTGRFRLRLWMTREGGGIPIVLTS